MPLDFQNPMWYYWFRKQHRKEVVNVMNYSKLRGKTRELGLRQSDVASAAHMSESTYSLKLAGKSQFTLREVRDIVEYLGIPAEEIPDYFFTPEVQKTTP